MRRCLYAMMGLMLLLGACDINLKPQLPDWDVDLTLPLLNERFLVSELVDSVNVVIGEDDVLTITATGEASTPDFGEVNFTPDIVLENLPLLSGIDIQTTVPLVDPTGTVFIAYGHLEQGHLDFNINLNDPVNSSVTLILPDITTPTGGPLTINSNDNPNWQSVNLKGCQVGVENSGQILDLLQVHLIIESNQPDGTPLGTGGIRINTQLGSDYFQGYLYNYVRAIDGTYASIDIDYPENFEEAVILQEAKVSLQLTNEVGFGATFHGQIHAVNAQTGQERWVDVLDDAGQPFFVYPAETSGPVITALSFSNGISEVLQIMPSRVELVNGYLLINGGHDGTPGFVRETERIHCLYQVDLPCHFVLNEYVFTMPTPTQISVSAETQSQILNRLLAANLTVEATNHIPVGATATLYVGNSELIDPADPASYSFAKQVTLHSSEYEGPEVNADGEQLINLALSSDELEVFGHPEVYVLASLSLEPSVGSVVIHASPADYIQIRGMLTAKVHVSEDLL
ncbi:MAG: hypothetical protein LHW45_07470 [Candidatus Cloacimonetes bacterium]|nr:hypothetical protein [Candidatus Cloacimonadota bacterium]MDY0367448.1 hypothetical protein [Candidatus Syntrophosphaera sp.]